MLERWGGFVARRAWAVLLAGIAVVLAAAAYGGGVFDHLSQGGFDDPASESTRAGAIEQELFGGGEIDVVAIYQAPEGSDLTVTDPAFRAAVEGALADLPSAATDAVVPWWSGVDPSMVSADGRSAQVWISLTGDSQNDYVESYDEVAPVLEADGVDLSIAGSYAVYNDVNELTSEDLARAELITLPLVLLLALVIFGSAVAATMPVLVALVSMLGALAVVRLITTFTEVSIFSVNVVTLLGIGLAIDYALFVVSRFREELDHLPGDDPDAVGTAIVRTMTTAGRTVLFSGLIVAASLGSLLIFPQAFLRSMGYGGMAAVVIAMLAALTMLPAVLRLLGRRVDAGRMPWYRGRSVAVDGSVEGGGAWGRLAYGVMRRPVAVMALTVAGLMILAAPFLDVRWGSVDHRVLPADAPAHVASDLLAEEFGGERSTASVLLQGASQADVAAYVGAAQQLDGVLVAQPTGQADGTTLVQVVWSGNSQTEASQDLVRELRAIDPGEGELLVGGMSAATVDLIASIGDHLPVMAVIVVLVMLVLLFIAFGSVVLPVKAVLVNVLSLGAAFGVVAWIFDDGNLADLLSFTPQGFLDVTNPILMLAILFGLSMDYEVFLLSRVREEWDRTGDNRRAVALGVQKTGRIITSAALLLGLVVGAFSMSGIVFMKMIGVGMLVALLIDATVVRALLVPATMRLLGRWNWWAPGPLARWWERYGFREEGRTPAVSAGPAEPTEPPAEDRVPAGV